MDKATLATFKELLGLYSEYGIGAFIIVFFMIVISLYIFKPAFLSNILTQLQSKKENILEQTPIVHNTELKLIEADFDEIKKIMQHDFFNFLNECLSFEIHQIRIEHLEKKKLLVKMLSIQIRCFIKDYKAYFENDRNFISKNIQDINGDFLALMEATFQGCVSEWRREAIPEIAIQKYSMYYRENALNIHKTMHRRFLLSTNKGIKPYVILASYMDVLQMGFQYLLTDARRSFNELNGELEALLEEK